MENRIHIDKTAEVRAMNARLAIIEQQMDEVIKETDELIKRAERASTRFSVDLLDGKYCTQLRRQYEPQGFVFDTRRHNRFQKWTIISHNDSGKLAHLREWFEAEGYETDNE